MYPTARKSVTVLGTTLMSTPGEDRIANSVLDCCHKHGPRKVRTEGRGEDVRVPRVVRCVSPAYSCFSILSCAVDTRMSTSFPSGQGRCRTGTTIPGSTKSQRRMILVSLSGYACATELAGNMPGRGGGRKRETQVSNEERCSSSG